ncbi:MAG: hypothetical protein HC881_14005 [Leptolyngbyaceae cyanobacterium SL_7_1]|nr:hypothetical protein [Leptolyngbyaceae cyanobacterium SL_7_1]
MANPTSIATQLRFYLRRISSNHRFKQAIRQSLPSRRRSRQRLHIGWFGGVQLVSKEGKP